MADQHDRILDTLRGRVLRGLRVGTLAAGDRLPSARALVAEFGVDHRFILAAYRALAEEGLVELRQRGGIYVAARGGALPLPEDWIVGVLAAGLAREIPAPEMSAWLRRCTETVRLRAAVVATTWDQLSALSRELREDFGLEPEGVLAESLHDDAPPPTVRRADLLVAPATHGARVRALGEAVGKPVIVIEVGPDRAPGEWALLLRRPLYAVVASEAHGEAMRRALARTPGVKNLRVLVLGRDDLSTIPESAPTYVTRPVRDALRGTRIPGRVLPHGRTIAAASARELLAFVVRANAAALARTGR